MSHPDRTVVCTLGMHRSGTSLVSRLLNVVGVFLGNDAAISGAGVDNPKGHWEHHQLALLNDELLVRFGGRWDVPPVFPAGWLQDAGVRAIADKARQVLAAEFANEPLWGWKDPRTCLTAPFWQDLVGPMRYVLCVRNPQAVVASLGRRNGMLAAHADRLWLKYVAGSLKASRGEARMLLFYEDVMSNWPREVARLAAFVGRPDRADDPSVRTAVAAFVDQELHHHQASPDDLVADAQMSFETKSLYLALRAHHGDSQNLDGLAAQAVAAAERWDGFHLTHAAFVADHAAQARTIADLAATRDDLLAGTARLTDERDQLAANLARLAADAATLRGDLNAAGRQLAEIQGSSAWALATWLRRVSRALWPAALRRRRV